MMIAPDRILDFLHKMDAQVFIMLAVPLDGVDGFFVEQFTVIERDFRSGQRHG